MIDSVLPLTDSELNLKQIQLDDLNDLGKAVVATAFPGFDDENRPSLEAVEGYLADMRKLTGFANCQFDPLRYRRFAGDATLARGRYHTIAGDANGSDNGTLVHELRNYYNPRNAGIIQIFDTSEPNDMRALGNYASKGSCLVVAFLPLAGRPNRFASAYTDEPKPMLVFLPLRLETRHVKNIVDLRDPETARVFTENLSQLEWNVYGAKLPCFPLRPPLTSFAQLLPALLEQSAGGGGLTNIVGIWLRKMGAQGLIFPSARVNASVEAWDGKVMAASGWNYIDYTDAATTHLEAVVDVGNAWPISIQHTPEGPQEDWLYPIPAAQIEFEAGGAPAGSWRVRGLRETRDALWRYLMAWECLDAFATADADDQVRPVYEWLFGMFSRVFPRYHAHEEGAAPQDAEGSVEVLGASSAILQEALLGLPERRAQVLDFAASIRQSHAELSTALVLLLDRSRQLAG